RAGGLRLAIWLVLTGGLIFASGIRFVLGVLIAVWFVSVVWLLRILWLLRSRGFGGRFLGSLQSGNRTGIDTGDLFGHLAGLFGLIGKLLGLFITELLFGLGDF